MANVVSLVVVQFMFLVAILPLQKATGCHEECSAVGLDDSSIIPDSSFTASSELRYEYGAKKARFSSDRCWEPNGNGNADDYLQIDLGKVFVICAVATKGNAYLNEWTTEYKILTSTDGNRWIPYSENNNSPKLFPGNTDRRTAVKHDMGTLLLARFIRFIPTKYKGYKALRVEVLQSDKKVYLNPCSTIGLADNNIIPDSSFTASSELRPEYGANKARFSSDRCWEPNGNGNGDDYLQVDLGKVFVICAVATKGNAKRASGEYTKQYKISTSSDGNLWIPYSENNNSPKMFSGNTDTVTAVKNDLVIPILAKRIRFTPTQYNGYKALRVEVYGFDAKGFSCSSLPVGVASVAKIPDNNMTSSSQYNTSTPASNGRLGYTAGSSWCAATSDSSPYLQVKLSSPYIICGVATQGDHSSDNWVQTYQIQTSTDGSTFTDYRHDNVIQDFVGNTDRDTVTKNPLYKGTVSAYVRVIAKNNYGTASCMRKELYGVQQNTVCSKMSIGVSYASLVPDHRFTTSSYYVPNLNRYIPSNARLRTNKAWEPETSNPQAGDWLQIDLGSVVYVCAVATQGNAYPTDEYAKKYKLKMSLDNDNWEYYKENNADKVFTGNTDRTTIVTNTLTSPTKTKFLRFYPTEFNSWAAMRVDVYGVTSTCSSPFGLEKSGSIKDTKMISSSKSDSAHAASFGRLYGDASWCSNVQANTEYLQVDLDKIVTLTGIATQGDRTMDKWVKAYTLKYSIYGRMWNEYREGQPSAKVFQGNSDNSSIVVRWFTHLVTVRYVRVFPQTWNTGICMRIELFGCRCQKTPLILDAPSVESILSRSAIVSWTPPLHKPIEASTLSYMITYWHQSTTKVIMATSQDRSKNISGLSPCTEYNVSITSYSVLGPAPWSDITTFKTDPEKPIVAVTGVKVQAKTSKSILVTWQVPVVSQCHQDITGFKVNYTKTSEGRTQLTFVNSSQSSSITFKNLDKWTEYSFTVMVCNKRGFGPASSAVVVRTLEDRPDAPPRNFKGTAKSSTQIDVSWDPPPRDKQNGLIRGYKLSYWNTGHQSQMKNLTSTNTTLDKLDMFTEYTINLLAYTNVGDGSVSNNITVRTMEGPPSKPTNVKTTTIGPVGLTGPRVEINWEPPSSPNGIIKGYKLSYGQIGNENTQFFVKDMRKYVFDVCGGVAYKVKVWAITARDGSKKESIVSVTNYAPVKVAIPKVIDYNTTTYNVTFPPLPDRNGRIITYELKIEQKKDNVTEDAKLVNTSCAYVGCNGSASHDDDCSHVLYNLKIRATYSIRVRAYTRYGPGPFSDEARFLTSSTLTTNHTKYIQHYQKYPLQ